VLGAIRKEYLGDLTWKHWQLLLCVHFSAVDDFSSTYVAATGSHPDQYIPN